MIRRPKVDRRCIAALAAERYLRGDLSDPEPRTGPFPGVDQADLDLGAPEPQPLGTARRSLQ